MQNANDNLYIKIHINILYPRPWTVNINGKEFYWHMHVLIRNTLKIPQFLLYCVI